MWFRITLAAILLVSSFPAVIAQEKASSEFEHTKLVSQTIERSLPFIQKHGEDWITSKKCATCHHSTFLVWSLNAAVDHGFSVDADKLAEWNRWVRDYQNILGPEGKGKDEGEDKTLRNRPEEVSQLLLGRRKFPAAKEPTNESAWSLAMRSHILDGQPKEDSWQPGGQLPGQKRPLRESQEVTTLWAMVAIRETGTHDESARAADARVAAWMNENTVGESTEWWAVKLLWERGRGNTEAANQCREKLLMSQREDGGWGWLLKEESDALGTGQALYALARDLPTVDHEALRRARDFLCRTQTENGSWPVKGTKENYRNRITPTATFWGTCWAVIALLESLPAHEAGLLDR